MIPLSSYTVYKLIRNSLGKIVPDNSFNHILTVSDAFYFTIPDVNWLKNKVEKDPVFKIRNEENQFTDKDDYAMYLKTRINLLAADYREMTRPFAIGFLFTDKHAFNIGIDDNNSLFVLDALSSNNEYIIPKDTNEFLEFLEIDENNNINLIYF